MIDRIHVEKAADAGVGKISLLEMIPCATCCALSAQEWV